FWAGLEREWESTRSLPGADGDEHKELREILRRGYSRESIKGRYDELVEITDGSIERDWKTGDKVPVVNAFQYMVTDQLGI
ncbi:MAG: cytochrome P450, partial [Nevskiales bacterium]